MEPGGWAYRPWCTIKSRHNNTLRRGPARVDGGPAPEGGPVGPAACVHLCGSWGGHPPPIPQTAETCGVGGAHPEGTLGYVTCAQAADSTKR